MIFAIILSAGANLTLPTDSLGEGERPDLTWLRAIPNDCGAAQVLLQHFEHINSTMSRYKFFKLQEDNNKLRDGVGRGCCVVSALLFIS